MSKAIRTIDIQPDSEGKFSCPECRKVYNDRAHLGIHRKIAHKIVGITHQGERRRASGNPLQIPPDVIRKILAMRRQGLSARQIQGKTGVSMASIYKYTTGKNRKGISSNKGDNPAKEQPGNGNNNPASFDHDPQVEQEITRLFGRLEKEAELFCLSHEIPKSHVANWLAKLFSLQAGRHGVRATGNRVPALRD